MAVQNKKGKTSRNRKRPVLLTDKTATINKEVPLINMCIKKSTPLFKEGYFINSF
jgi:hypothetical protein